MKHYKLKGKKKEIKTGTKTLKIYDQKLKFKTRN